MWEMTRWSASSPLYSALDSAFQQVQQELGRLLWPATLRCSVDLGLSMSADASHEPAEGDDFLVLDDVLQVLDSSVQGHLLDGLSRLASVLEVNTKVGSFGLGRFGRVLGLLSVTTHIALVGVNRKKKPH